MTCPAQVAVGTRWPHGVYRIIGYASVREGGRREASVKPVTGRWRRRVCRRYGRRRLWRRQAAVQSAGWAHHRPALGYPAPEARRRSSGRAVAGRPSTAAGGERAAVPQPPARSPRPLPASGVGRTRRPSRGNHEARSVSDSVSKQPLTLNAVFGRRRRRMLSADLSTGSVLPSVRRSEASVLKPYPITRGSGAGPTPAAGRDGGVLGARSRSRSVTPRDAAPRGPARASAAARHGRAAMLPLGSDKRGYVNCDGERGCSPDGSASRRRPSPAGVDSRGGHNLHP